MTVAELITELQTLHPDLEVFVSDNESGLDWTTLYGVREEFGNRSEHTQYGHTYVSFRPASVATNGIQLGGPVNYKAVLLG